MKRNLTILTVVVLVFLAIAAFSRPVAAETSGEFPYCVPDHNTEAFKLHQGVIAVILMTPYELPPEESQVRYCMLGYEPQLYGAWLYRTTFVMDGIPVRGAFMIGPEHPHTLVIQTQAISSGEEITFNFKWDPAKLKWTAE